MTEESSWKITDKKMKVTDNGYFLHCLPTRRNLEIADDVLDSEYSLVLKQAKNRIIAAQMVIKGAPKTNPIKNALIVLNKLMERGVDIEADKARFNTQLNSINRSELKDLK